MNTPGPWSIVMHRGKRPNYSVIVEDGSEDGKLVASVQNVSLPDAKLIASAPDLLAALESASSILEDWDHHTVQCDEFDYCHNCRVRRELFHIEFAIAKAKEVQS